MPQASIFACARPCNLDPEGDLLCHAEAATDGNRTPLPLSPLMQSNVASMLPAVVLHVVTKSFVQSRAKV
jgi:hypothetical protein